MLQGMSANLAGRAIGLVGANGAGKSTLIGALLGVLKAESGSASVLGLKLPGDACELRTRCGVMAEQAGIFPGGSGVEAVTFAGMLTGLKQREALRRAHRVLDALEVGEERYRATKGYSTGMRQRCKLAMSLVHDPELLILDEPTVGLDPPGRLQLLELIRHLRDQGRRILLSTHILHDAEFLCDELLLVEAGTIAYSGPLSDLVERDGSRLAAQGEEIGPEFGKALADLGISVESATEGQVIFFSKGDADLEAFWNLARFREASVRSLGSEIASLEEAVVKKMGGGNA